MLTKMARNQKQAYRSIMKTLNEQIWSRSKQCIVINVFFHSANRTKFW